MTFDRREQGRARTPKSSNAVLEQSLQPTVEGLQQSTARALRRAASKAESQALADSKQVSITAKVGKQTIAHGLGKAVTRIVPLSGVSVSLVSSDRQTLTLSASASGAAVFLVS